METLQHADQQVSALNDLIRINNDRITGYKKRIGITYDHDLDYVFSQFVMQSQHNINDLVKYIYFLGSKPADGSSLSGKFYHAWMDLKLTIIKQNKQAVLDYSEHDEDVAESAYQKAMDEREIIWEDKNIVTVLKRQLNGLKKSHKLIVELLKNTSAAV